MNQGNEPLFDIVILVGPNDRNIITKQIIYTKKTKCQQKKDGSC